MRGGARGLLRVHDGVSVCITLHEVSRVVEAPPLLPGGFALGKKGLKLLLFEVSRAGVASVR